MYYCKITILTSVIVIVGWKHILSLQIIPERAMLRYINEKYLYENVTLVVRRYWRKSGYYINIQGTNKMQWGNNVSYHAIFFEFLHNEYKRSFVEMKFDKICDMVHHDAYVGRAIKVLGIECPLPPGTHRIMNISFSIEHFPYVWPFERCKVEGTLKQNQNGDTIAIGEVYFLFKQKNKHK